jgi:multiple sugar transport system ATP-binding protein
MAVQSRAVLDLRVNDLTVRYNERPAIEGASFTVEPGELCVLVGPSGSGKSTILRAIAGYAPIEQGDIFVGDTRLNDLPPQHRDIAMVFQQRALYPHMTVWENWAFPLEAIKTPKDEIHKRVVLIGEILQMTPFLNRYPRELSGGQQQRVAIGRALIRRPKAFLLDEPLSGLDAKLRIETRSYIRRLHGDLGATMIYVTHNQAEAQAIGDKIVVLNQNQLQQVGTPDMIYNHPANIFVAEFLGSPPINLIDCELEGDFDILKITHKGYSWTLSAEKSAEIRARKTGREVVLGVRPECIRLYREAGAGRLPAQVYVTEPQGHEVIVDLSFEGKVLRARQDREQGLGEDLTLNEQLYMEFDLTRCHLFERQTRTWIGSQLV